MRHLYTALTCALILVAPARAQDAPTGPAQVTDFYVGPFVQHVTTTSAWIVWESDSGSDSTVEFGPTGDLGRTATGNSIPSEGPRRIHSARIDRLSPDTRFYYRVSTGAQTSEVFWFRTPPVAAAEKPFRFVAVSDTQTDWSNDDQLLGTVNDGIIRHLAATYGGDLADQLAFAVLAGDVVDNGNNYPEWKTEFFDETESLLHYVPLYPVAGNHEQDARWYFDYFHLPENGTQGYLEHWYWTDYSNVRVIGLDSNGGYRVQAQLDWLDGVLADAGADDDIDFVFAQLHHPFKSELWLPGELDYTGEIVGRLEAFTEQTGKPSVHFFGHTHGYSRGQSRDHRHLWINVASGEGNPDYWGEYAQRDYPEFQYSTPEYGFVVVDVEAGDTPRFRVQRYSLGNEFVERDNELIDEITVRMFNTPPATPAAIFPADGQTDLPPDLLTLRASPFADADGDDHWESHFQITATPGDYTSPAADEWVRFENWYSPPDASGPPTGYYSVNTVADPDVSRAEIRALEPNRSYAWRVRYRDQGLEWSGWSEEASFTTGAWSGSDNLLENPGAESGADGWTVLDEPLESLGADDCGSGTQPAEGSRFFAVGGVCAGESEYGEAVQRADISELRYQIDEGLWRVRFGATLKDYAGSDRPEVWLTFLSERFTVIDQTQRLGTLSSQWERVGSFLTVPRGTRHIEFHLAGTRHAGADNDSYADALELLLIPEGYCTADFNSDGAVNTQDFLVFLNAWAAGDDDADVNHDDDINVQDVLAFLNLWPLGCA
ncbi:MAG: fibronectin type III domain-containing protein [Phycisphaerales bacterium]|nr:fibronectin type III domain-containing protein [Phycisphaerales bacterium]